MGWTGADSLTEADKEAHIQEVPPPHLMGKYIIVKETADVLHYACAN